MEVRGSMSFEWRLRVVGGNGRLVALVANHNDLELISSFWGSGTWARDETGHVMDLGELIA